MQLNSSIAAVVTGGASGLGEATVRSLASHGVKVAIFDMNEAKGEAVAKEVGGVFCKVNVTSEEEVDAAFAKARAAHGQERILVNGDGIRVNTILPGIFNTPLMNAAPPQVKEALAQSVPFPKRLGNAEDYAQLALTMITNGYFNGEDVRLDGAIRMAPR